MSPPHVFCRFWTVPTETGKPPAGAGPVSTSVPIDPMPPGTEGGVSDSALAFGAWIVRSAAADPVPDPVADSPMIIVLLVPSVTDGWWTPGLCAVIRTVMSIGTGDVLIEKVADDPPAGMFTDAGIDGAVKFVAVRPVGELGAVDPEALVKLFRDAASRASDNCRKTPLVAGASPSSVTTPVATFPPII